MNQDKNAYRQFLVTKFVCADCGSLLNLSYNAPTGPLGDYADGEPTGGHMVQQKVAVEPCRKCAEPMEDAEKMAKILVRLAGSA